jgi:hypothetical protein
MRVAECFAGEAVPVDPAADRSSSHLISCSSARGWRALTPGCDPVRISSPHLGQGSRARGVREMCPVSCSCPGRLRCSFGGTTRRFQGAAGSSLLPAGLRDADDGRALPGTRAAAGHERGHACAPAASSSRHSRCLVCRSGSGSSDSVTSAALDDKSGVCPRRGNAMALPSQRHTQLSKLGLTRRQTRLQSWEWPDPSRRASVRG